MTFLFYIVFSLANPNERMIGHKMVPQGVQACELVRAAAEAKTKPTLDASLGMITWCQDAADLGHDTVK